MEFVATRDAVLESLQQLPVDATLDEMIEQVILVSKIKTGLAQSEAGDLISHQEVTARFAR